MLDLFCLATLVVAAALLAWLSYRAWRARNGLLKWGGTGIAALLSTTVTLTSLIAIVGLFFVKWNLLGDFNPSGKSLLESSAALAPLTMFAYLGLESATVPAGDVTASGPLTATGYAVFSGSHNLQASYAFVKFAQSPPSQTALAEQLGLLPSRAAAYTAEAVKADPVLGAFLPVIKTGTPLPQVQIQPSMVLVLDDNFRAALVGNESPQSAMDTVAAAWQKDLNGGYTIGPANP